MSNLPDMLYIMGVPALQGIPFPRKGGKVWFVDGSTSVGAATNPGDTIDAPFAKIQTAIDAAGEGDTIIVFPKKMAATDTDPGSYAEALTIDVPDLSIIGVSRGRTQGGLPQLKCSATALTTAIITVQVPGVLIANLGINGAGSTGGGIKILDDGGTTYSVFGLTILNCHFKNCKCHATHGSAGGAIYWGTGGGGWQVLIKGCRFYKNVGDIVCLGTGVSVPQDVVIEDNIFSQNGADCDVHIKVAGSGIIGLVVRDNVFPCFPALASGDVGTNVVLATGTTGVFCRNYFGTSGKSYGASGKTNTFPTTVLLAGNYDETSLVART